MSDGDGSQSHRRLPDGPLTGLRVIEFGQLLAGPYVGTLLGDFGADVVKIEGAGAGGAAGGGGRDARVGPPAPQRPLALVVDPRPQQALGHAEPARGRGPADRDAPLRVGGRRARELPPRDDGEVGPRPRRRPRAQPEGDLRARDRLRPEPPPTPPG